jgi:hypothetical protein
MAYTPIPEHMLKDPAFGDTLADRKQIRSKAKEAVLYLRALEMRYDIRYVPHETLPKTWVAVKTLKPEYANK